jgi:hypothetical protein
MTPSVARRMDDTGHATANSGMTPPSPRPPEDLSYDLLACALIIATIVTTRLPAILLPAELNVDESQLMVQALRYAHDWVPWRSVDGTTSGPLNSWLLVLTQALGVPLSYRAVHAIGAVILGSLVALSYVTIRACCPRPEALVVACAGTLVVGATYLVEFMHLASEHLPALMLAVAAHLIIRAIRAPSPAVTKLSAAAFLAGAAPWAKLQAAPPALIVIGFAVALPLAAAWRADGVSARRLRIHAVVVAVAALLPTLVILGLVWHGSALGGFWDSYIVTNFYYAKDPRPAGTFFRALNFPANSQLAGLVIIVLLLTVIAISQLRRLYAAGAARRGTALAFAALLFAAAFFATVRPPTAFPHYEIFLIAPSLLLIGQWVGVLTPDPIVADAPGRRLRLVLAAAVLGPAVVMSARQADGWLQAREHTLVLARTASRGLHENRAMARAIVGAAPQARTMAVWGWMPALYVETGLASSTRHAIGHYLIEPGPRQAELRATFLHDIQQEKPDILVDAVAHGCFTWIWQDLRARGMESFPALASYVRENYTLRRSVILDPQGTPLRVFVRNDLTPSPPRPGPATR